MNIIFNIRLNMKLYMGYAKLIEVMRPLYSDCYIVIN